MESRKTFNSLIPFQRVMPSCLFCLLRFYLRVDGTLIRVIDTRIYHQVRR